MTNEGTKIKAHYHRGIIGFDAKTLYDAMEIEDRAEVARDSAFQEEIVEHAVGAAVSAYGAYSSGENQFGSDFIHRLRMAMVPLMPTTERLVVADLLNRAKKAEYDLSEERNYWTAVNAGFGDRIGYVRKPYVPASSAEVDAALGITHQSDCAIYNGPMLPAGPCDCGGGRVETDAPMSGDVPIGDYTPEDARALGYDEGRAAGAEELHDVAKWILDAWDGAPGLESLSLILEDSDDKRAPKAKRELESVVDQSLAIYRRRCPAPEEHGKPARGESEGGRNA